MVKPRPLPDAPRGEEVADDGLSEAAQAPRARMSLLRRILLAIVLLGLTLLSADLAIRAGRFYLDRAKKLTFCVSRDGVDQRFAARLAKVAAAQTQITQSMQISLKPTPSPIPAFDHRDCDLVVARADDKLPGSARSLAVLEKDIVLLIAHRGHEPETSAALRRRKLILASPGADNEALLRAILATYGMNKAERRLEVAKDAASAAALFKAHSANLIFTVVPRSKLLQGALLQGLTRETPVAFADLPEAAALAKKIRGAAEETVEKGLFSAAPLLPADDLSTLSLEVRLVARSALRNAAAAELTRLALENRGDLALNGEFADAIEPPDTDKDAPMLAHTGSAQYVNDDEKSFLDIYGDYIYLGAPVAGGVGSFLLWLFGRWAGGASRQAGDLTDEVLEVAAMARSAASEAELEAADERLDHILHEALCGLREKKIGADGLDVFRLAYEQTREWIRVRRHSIARGLTKSRDAEEKLL
jgi:TRAP-type uncharacterized transport system substrate-binding protein